MQTKFILTLLASSLSLTTAAASPGARANHLAVRQIDPSIPTKTDEFGNIVPFSRRQVNTINVKRAPQIPAEVPTRSDAQGNPVPFGQKKRRETDGLWRREPIAQIPAERAVKTGPDGIPVPF